MRGVFTKKAKRKKMSVQKYANYVIKKYKGKKKTKKQLKLLRQAVFAKTAKKWKKRKKKSKKKRGGTRGGFRVILKENRTSHGRKTGEPHATFKAGMSGIVEEVQEIEDRSNPQSSSEFWKVTFNRPDDWETSGRGEVSGLTKLWPSNFFERLQQQQGGRRKKTRKKRSKGGDYSPMAKFVLGKKARKLRKATKKIQPIVRGYLTRKNLPPPKKDYSKMTYEEMRDDDY